MLNEQILEAISSTLTEIFLKKKNMLFDEFGNVARRVFKTHRETGYLYLFTYVNNVKHKNIINIAKS